MTLSDLAEYSMIRSTARSLWDSQASCYHNGCHHFIFVSKCAPLPTGHVNKVLKYFSEVEGVRKGQQKTH